MDPEQALEWLRGTITKVAAICSEFKIGTDSLEHLVRMYARDAERVYWNWTRGPLGPLDLTGLDAPTDIGTDPELELEPAPAVRVRGTDFRTARQTLDDLTHDGTVDDKRVFVHEISRLHIPSKK